MRTVALAVLAGLLVCASGEGAPAARKPVGVVIEAMKFAPADVTVKPGDTIVWTNKDIVAHTVTAKTGAFDSKVIPPGGTFKYVARKKGAFAYICSLHPMTAKLKVRPTVCRPGLQTRRFCVCS
jgi:plastocyanin